MKKIIRYFFPSGELNYFEEKRTNAFIIFNLIILVIVPILLIQSLIFQTSNVLVLLKILPVVELFALGNLFLLRRKGLRLAGNVLSIGLILFDALALNILTQEVSVLIKFTQGFYLALAILIINAMFGSRLVLIINSTIILATAVRVYIFGLEQLVNQRTLLTAGFIFYVISLVIIIVIVYFLIRFAESAVYKANSDADKSNKQNKLLNKLIDHIQENSNHLLLAGNQLSAVSQEIAADANEQAASTEEISSSIEQILSTIVSRTQNAVDAGMGATKSANEMKENSVIFLETIAAVTEISKKITIISEIAGKTDLLSINAAIEASRAGDVGRGFAVVADEIRKLADKTKLASDEIIRLSKNGQQISEIAGSKLEKLIPEIIESAKGINSIVFASKDLESGVQSINHSVIQLSDIANKNSASAEEMSSSAEELTIQAEQLKQIISDFRDGNIKL